MKVNENVFVFIFLLSLGVVFYFLFHFIPDKKLEKEHRYTIATIIEFEIPVEGEEMAKFKYSVNNINYISFFTINPYGDKKYKKGDRLYLKFYPKDPNVCDLILNNDVSNSITEAPIGGWEKISR